MRAAAPREHAAAARRSIAADEGFNQLVYGLRWRVHGVRPGGHRGMGSGRLGALRTVVPLDRNPDVRRIDLRASLRDPFGRWYVRDHTPFLAAKICILADVTRSMAFDDGRREWMADLCEALSAAARRNGDELGVYCCDRAIRENASSSPRAAPPRPEVLAASLYAEPPAGDGAAGLAQAAARLAGRRKLVFVVSDFEFDVAELRAVFELLSNHDVVPIVLGGDALAQLPAWGLAELVDLESGQRRLAWLRPGLLRRWRDSAQARGRVLDALSAEYGWRVLRLHGPPRLDALARYLLAR